MPDHQMLEAAMSRDNQEHEPKIIEYVPKGRFAFNWKVVSVLLLLWVAVLLAMVFLKAPMFRIIWPIIALSLVGYLLFCTLAALRRK